MISHKRTDTNLLQARSIQRDIGEGNPGYLSDVLQIDSRSGELFKVDEAIVSHLKHRDYAAVLVPNSLRVSHRGIADAIRAQHLDPIFVYGGPEVNYAGIGQPYGGVIEISCLLESKGGVQRQLTALLSQPTSQ